MKIPAEVTTNRSILLLPLTLFLALALSLLAAGPAAAAPIGKGSTIHACYKAKGKGRGTLRLVPSATARCPKNWKKVSWQVAGTAGPRGEEGPRGGAGVPGVQGLPGANGLPGADGTAIVKELEVKVSELQAKVQTLEGVLAGVANQDLVEAIGLAPTVQALCTQTGALTSQLNAIESALGGLSLNSTLTVLGGILNIPALPGALPAFNCPS